MKRSCFEYDYIFVLIWVQGYGSGAWSVEIKMIKLLRIWTPMFNFINDRRNFSRLQTTRNTNQPQFGTCFDIDGVLVRGRVPFPETFRALQLLCDEFGKFKIPVIFLTNGCNKNQDKADQLTQWFKIKVEVDQIIQAHCPLKLFHSYKRKHCLVIGQGPVTEIAHNDLDFTDVCTIDEISAAYPLLDVVDHEKCYKIATLDVVESNILPVEAILIFGEPRQWETPLQLLVDLLLTNGKPVQSGRRYLHQTLPLLACNPDLHYMGRSSYPRYGNGAFLLCLEALFKNVTGQDLNYTAIVGKPSETTFRYAEHCAAVIQKRMNNLQPLKRLYMIGDNTEVDVYGANLYQRYINSSLDHRCLPASRRPPSSDLVLAQTVEFIEPLLVLSGVSGANICAKQSVDEKDRGKVLSDHHQTHQEFSQSDPTLFVPAQTFNHVLDAVSYVVEKEQLH